MPAVIGHDAILRELRGLALSEEPPHALLFAGPEGTGRTLLALEYARALNCEALHPSVTAGASMLDLAAGGGDSPLIPHSSFLGPCGACRPCRLIDAHAHPDVIFLGPGDVLCKPRAGDSAHPSHATSRDIRICQVRGLIELASRYPFEAHYRLVVIDPAHLLALAAAQAILKTLEEPPGHTAFALITSAPEALPETIVSRCRRINVPIVPRAVIEAGLAARGVDPATAGAAAAASRGRPGLAVAFAAEPGSIGDRERLLERCAALAAARTAERFVYATRLAERFRENRARVLGELDVWEAFWETALREAAAAGPGTQRERIGPPLRALRAIARAREDLQANVLARAAFELMLLRFPRRTMATPDEIAASAAPTA